MNLAFVLAAAVCIGQVETLTRQHDTFLGAMSRAWPFIIVGQFCLYNIFSNAPSVMVAWISFTITMSLVRVGMSYLVLGEHLDLRWVTAAICLMTVAALCMKEA